MAIIECRASQAEQIGGSQTAKDEGLKAMKF